MKALVGSLDHRPYQLLAENTALRGKVVELREELNRLEQENAALRRELAAALDRLDQFVGIEQDVDLTGSAPDIEVALTSG